MKYSVRVVGEIEDFMVEAEEVLISDGVIQFLAGDRHTALFSTEKLIRATQVVEKPDEPGAR